MNKQKAAVELEREREAKNESSEWKVLQHKRLFKNGFQGWRYSQN